uniref:Uncharacterized protein n=1 Tax=Aplanochytrium stocchinoi TaxID=215587 RepID=A0A7S3PI83_9STRA
MAHIPYLGFKFPIQVEEKRKGQKRKKDGREITAHPGLFVSNVSMFNFRHGSEEAFRNNLDQPLYIRTTINTYNNVPIHSYKIYKHCIFNNIRGLIEWQNV